MGEAGPVVADATEALRCPLVACEDRIRLRGKPGNIVGVMQIRRAAHPGEAAFKTATNDIAETAFGYHQRLSFAPLLRTSLPIASAVPRNLSFRSMPSPGTQAAVPVSFSVDPLTPPGVYEAVFDVAGGEQAAEIEVLPVERLDIVPRSLAVTGRAGARVQETVVLTNSGNVPMTLDVLGMLVLQEDEQICLSIQRALGEVKSGKREGEPYEQFLSAFITSVAERKTDFGRVRLADGAIVLAAGESREARLAIHLPRDIIAGRQYGAQLKTHGVQLFVHITAVAGSKAASADPATKEA